MEKTSAVLGLDELKSTKMAENICESCIVGKATQAPHRRREKKLRDVLELLHTDLTGPISPTGLNGELYTPLLIDDFSGAIWCSTMDKRSDAAAAKKEIVLHAQHMTNKKCACFAQIMLKSCVRVRQRHSSTL